MRQKDAETVAHVLGNELRLALPTEVDGLEAAVEAVRSHMQYVHPEFDNPAFERALQRAKDGHAFDPITTHKEQP